MIFQPQVVKCGLYATYKEHFSSNFRRAKEKRRRVEEGASKKRRKREKGAAMGREYVFKGPGEESVPTGPDRT